MRLLAIRFQSVTVGFVLLAWFALLLGASTFQSPSPSLVAYWALNETSGTAVLDSSGNGRTGSYVGNPIPSTTNLPPLLFPNPACLTFSSGNYVSVPDAPSLRLTSDMSVAFWMFKTAEVGDWQRLVGKGNPTQRNFGVWEWAGADGRIKFQQYNSGGGSILELDGTFQTALNTWYHIACTISGNTARLFINGTQNVQGTRSGVPGTSADPLTLGYATFHTYFPGRLDDVRIYNRAITPAEAAYLASGGGPPAAPPALTATAGVERVTLSWSAPAGATAHHLKRSTTAGGPYTTVAPALPVTTFIDTDVASGTPYYYVVASMNVTGESGNSNEATATPLFPPPDINTPEDGCGSTVSLRHQVSLWVAALFAICVVFVRRKEGLAP